MKKFMVLFVVLMSFGLTGCQGTQVQENSARIGLVMAETERINKRIDNVIGVQEEMAESVANRFRALKSGQIKNSIRIDKNSERIGKNSDRIKKNSEQINRLSALSRQIHREIGTAKLDTGNYTGPKRVWLMVGPYTAGSATAPVAVIASDIREVSKSLASKAVIAGVTYETVATKVVGFHDFTPIKKSGWKSNEALAHARANNVAKQLGLPTTKVETSNNSKLFGIKKEDNRYTYVLTETRIVE